jgi:hypothetical protein
VLADIHTRAARKGRFVLGISADFVLKVGTRDNVSFAARMELIAGDEQISINLLQGGDSFLAHCEVVGC